MNRRRYIAAVTAAAVAGCSTGDDGTPSAAGGEGGGDSGADGGDGGDAGPDSAGGDATTRRAAGVTDQPNSGPTGDVRGPADYEFPISRDQLNRGAPKDAIPAIVDPKFADDWSDLGGSSAALSLSAEDDVIGVERDGEARAYPLSILNWHEVVNDEFAGPLLVTYCPLCGSGVTAERRVDGEVTRFGVSGLLWNSDLVMYDEKTASLWSQLIGTAIRGPRAGTSLSFVPSTLTTWGAWTETHPQTQVLLPPPESGTIAEDGSRSYGRDPYRGYDSSESIGIGYNDFQDDRLHPKAWVVGVRHGGQAKAYPTTELGFDATVEDTVGGLSIVVTTTDEGSLAAYERAVDDETLSFSNAGPMHLRAGGSRWNKVSGRAVDGPFEGTTLTRANDRSELFWFAWADFYPDTEVYRSDE